jgi:hypothetical protein
MAYKFQLGAFRASGSLTQEGGVTAEDSALSGSSLNVGTAVLSESELEVLDGVSAGTAAASKALVLDSNKLITGITTITASYISASSIQATHGTFSANSLIVGSTTISETEIALLDGLTVGTVAASKAVTVDASKDFSGFRNISGSGNIDGGGDLTMATITMTGFSVDADGDTALKSLAIDDSSTIGCDSDTDLLTLSDGLVVVAGEMQVTTLDIGGTNVTATATELNFLDGFGSATYAFGDDSVAYFDATDSKLKYTSGQNFLAAVAGDGVASSGGRLAVQVTGAVVIQSDYLALSSSVAGTGIEVGAADGQKVDTLSIDLTNVSALGGTGLHQTQDHFMFSDNGAIKKITFSNLEDAIFANISGDAAVAAGGALTIAAGAVEHGMLADDIISGQTALGGASVAQADLLMLDDGPGEVKKVTFSNFEDSIFGNVSSDATIAAGGALTIADNAVSLAKMASLAAGKIILGDGSNDPAAVTLSGDATVSNSGVVSLAAAQTNVTSLFATDIKIGEDNDTKIDFETADEIKFYANGNQEMVIDDNGVVIAGNLTVQGTTTSVNSTTINISSSFTFEGPADAHETILTSATPVADTTIELPQLNAGTYYLPALAADPGTTAIAATVAEINLLDGGNSASSVTLVDGDGFILNDGGTMKVATMSSIKSYVGGTTNVSLKDNSEDLDVGFNYFAALGGAESCNLPASPEVGQIVQLKAPSNCSSTNTITVNKQGSHTIDGGTSIVLESPDAAVSFVYVTTNTWKVY